MKNKIHNIKKQKARRQSLRNNMTNAEIVLWLKLKGKQLGYKFRRQHGIGKYIVDFYCAELKLIIEIDGDVHALDKQTQLDEERQKYLESLHYKVIRYNNNDILTNINGALDDLISCMETLKTANPSAPPLGQEEEGSIIINRQI